MPNRGYRNHRTVAMTIANRRLLANLRPAALLLCFFSLAVTASTSQQGLEPAPAQPSEQITDLVERIESLPIEYRADLTFTLLKQAPQKVSRAQRSRLLHSILADSYTAKYPWPLVYANSQGGTVDSQRALDLVWLPLDTVSIQAKALALSSDQPDMLWAAFDRLPSPHKRTDCSESLTPDAGPYYKAMIRLLNRSLPGVYPNQISAEQYLIEAMQRIESPAQLLGWLDAVNTYDLDAGRQNDLVLALVSRLGSVSASDREMSGIEGPDESLTEAIHRFVIRQKLSSQVAAILLQAYRGFLISGLHQQECDDFTLDRAVEAGRFDALDPSLIGESPKPIPALSEADLAPTGRGGSANVELIQSDSLLREQTHRLFEMFESNQENRYESLAGFSPLQPQGSDIRDILSTVNDISQTTGQSELSSYENRQALLMTALKLLRSGPSFEDIVDAEVAFLSLNPVEQSSPPEWLRALKDLVLLSRPVPTAPGHAGVASDKAGDGKLNPALDTAFIRSTLRRYQSDRIIAAYMAYEDTIRPVYQF